MSDERLAEPDARLAEILIDDWANGTAPYLTFEPTRKCGCSDCEAELKEIMLRAIFG